MLEVRPVDPRDQRWEVDDPRYRVCFWDAGGASEEWELVGGDVIQVLAWARESARDRRFVLSAVVVGPAGLGLVRLAGTDPGRT